MTRKQTLWGGGALEFGDHRLVEDGGDRGGALVSDAIVPDPARERWEHSERAVACQWALTQKRTLFGSRGASLLQRLQRGVALESLGESSSSFGAEPVSLETVSMRTGWVLRAVNGR